MNANPPPFLARASPPPFFPPRSAPSLWRDDISKPMYADKRANGIGDIITIVVQENTTANKNNETKTERQSSLNAAITSFLYSPGASGLLTKGNITARASPLTPITNTTAAAPSPIPNPSSPTSPPASSMCCPIETW